VKKASKYFVIFLIALLFFWGCEEFIRRKIGGFAGSYPFVEYWDLKATESEVINAIIKLKKEHPSLQPPNQEKLFFPRRVDYDWGSDEMKKHLELSLKDSTIAMPPMTKSNTKADYWLYIDFYYPDTKEIVHTWIRPDYDDTTTTTLAFVSLSKNNGISKSRLINRDFWYLENKWQIRKFKSKILDPIQEKIDKKRKGGTD
jgi:hypothetical protein